MRRLRVWNWRRLLRQVRKCNVWERCPGTALLYVRVRSKHHELRQVRLLRASIARLREARDPMELFVARDRNLPPDVDAARRHKKHKKMLLSLLVTLY